VLLGQILPTLVDEKPVGRITVDVTTAADVGTITSMRKLTLVVVVVVLGAVGAYVSAGTVAGPAIVIAAPGPFAGADIPLDVMVDAANGMPAAVQVDFEQNGVRTHVFSSQTGGAITATITRDSAPGLNIQSGPARIIVTARGRVWRIRNVDSEAVVDVHIRLEKPRVSVVSTKHYVNLGGSEMIVYRATPSDVVSGVRVGELEYPGYPAAGATVAGTAFSDPDLRIAFFALRYDQDVNTPMRLFARDPAGQEATGEFDHLAFAKPFKRSTITLDDRFIDRVVPAILAGATANAEAFRPTGSLVEQYVAINSEFRTLNNAQISALSAQTSPELLWGGQVFHPFTNTKVEAAFADFRTYRYGGQDVDHQVHLGFDLASFANTPILAANRGTVLWAAELGIYGNCVIIDHGMGVQSLYGHLSSFAVQAGAMVDKDQEIGKSGVTGLAGGDHLHFTMLVNGHMVNPIEWWDSHWIADRILRKLK
jgi:murein DD-endopeptidase MepM/ murein hydrolase activator NlpD